MNDASLSPEQMEKLLQLAARRLGTDAQTLRNAYQQGGLSGISASLSDDDSTKVASYLQDKEKTAALLQDPAIQRLLIQLLG